MLRSAVVLASVLAFTALWGQDGSGENGPYSLEGGGKQATDTADVERLAPPPPANAAVIHDPAMVGRRQGEVAHVAAAAGAPARHDSEPVVARPQPRALWHPAPSLPAWTYWQGFYLPWYRSWFPYHRRLICPLPVIVTDGPVFLGGYCGPGFSLGRGVGAYWRWRW
jgi:hypothetical protein